MYIHQSHRAACLRFAQFKLHLNKSFFFYLHEILLCVSVFASVCECVRMCIEKDVGRGAWLAQWKEPETVDLQLRV